MKIYRSNDGSRRARFQVDFLLAEDDLAGALAEQYLSHPGPLPDLTEAKAKQAVRESLWGNGMFSDTDIPEQVMTWAREQVRRLFGPDFDASRNER